MVLPCQYLRLRISLRFVARGLLALVGAAAAEQVDADAGVQQTHPARDLELVVPVVFDRRRDEEVHRLQVEPPDDGTPDAELDLVRIGLAPVVGPAGASAELELAEVVQDRRDPLHLQASHLARRVTLGVDRGTDADPGRQPEAHLALAPPRGEHEPTREVGAVAGEEVDAERTAQAEDQRPVRVAAALDDALAHDLLDLGLGDGRGRVGGRRADDGDRSVDVSGPLFGLVHAAHAGLAHDPGTVVLVPETVGRVGGEGGVGPLPVQADLIPQIPARARVRGPDDHRHGAGGAVNARRRQLARLAPPQELEVLGQGAEALRRGVGLDRGVRGGGGLRLGRPEAAHEEQQDEKDEPQMLTHLLPPSQRTAGNRCEKTEGALRPCRVGGAIAPRSRFS